MKFRHLLSGIFLFSAVLSGQAQDFTRLDWDVLHIDSLVPHYTEVIPLDSDFAAYDYTVSVRYPELRPLTEAETVRLSALVQQLPENPEVESRVGISRKQGYLDVRFIPIVCRDGRYYKILSCQIAIDRHRKSRVSRVAASSSSERYAASSVLSQGRWVKIRVAEDGVYMLTASELKKMGFSDPSRVKLYGYGGHLQDEEIDADNDYDDLSEIPLYPGKNGLLFYARGVVKWNDPVYNSTAMARISKHTVNNYSTHGYYFLTEGDTPLSFTTEEYAGAVATQDTTFMDQVLYERDEYAWFSGGRRLFDSYDYYNGNSQTYKLSTPGAVASGAASLRVVFTAASSTRTTVETEVNGTALTSFSVGTLGSYLKGVSAERTFAVRNMSADPTTQVSISTTQGNHARLDFLELNYTRRLSVDDAYLHFRGDKSTATEFVLSNPSGRNLAVWRLGDASRLPVRMSGQAAGTTYRFKAERASDQYVAVDVDAEFPKPEYVGEIANQNLHAVDSLLDMVIIVPQSGKLTAQAERLAEAHTRLDGMKVLVVRADQIYNEFSSGTPDATAYRRFMKMLYDRAATADEAPRYLLLFGDAAWDNRMLSSAWKQENPEDYLLCYESDDSFSDISCYVMEDYFGLLDDGEGSSLKTEKVDLGVGRFPVTTEQDARNLVDKTINYMENREAGSWKNTVVILGDDGDDNLHMKSAEVVAQDIEKYNPEYDLRRIYWDAYPIVTSTTGNSYPEVHKQINKQMEEGALIVNYTGHAATYGLSHEFVLVLDDFKNFISTKVPLWVTAACDVMPFDTRTENVGETALLNPSAGALAFFGTARTVYADDNLYMNRYFSHYVLGRDENGRRYRLGDAVRLSKVSLLDPEGDMGYDNTQNKLHYALLGDPALLVGGAEYRVVLDSINGKSISSDDESWPALSAGTLARVSGHVERLDGTRVPSFTGSVTTQVYDSKQQITCNNNAGAKTPFQFNTRDKILFAGTDSVRNGSFSTTFPVPLDINYSNNSGRMVFYAVSADRKEEANGYSEQFFVGGTGSDLLTDTLGPEIRVWLNDIESPAGARVNTTPMFRAALKDPSGINTTGNGIGHDLELVIDDNPVTTYNLNSSYVNEFGDYQEGSVTYILPQLSAGKHKMRFRAWDTMNNSSMVEYEFEVDPGLRPNITRLYATQNPARTTTNFVFAYDRPGETCDFTIEVMDFAGRKLWQHTERGVSGEGVYSVLWNLTAGGGARLGTGVYFYRAVVTSSDGVKSASETEKIIILGNK